MSYRVSSKGKGDAEPPNPALPPAASSGEPRVVPGNPASCAAVIPDGGGLITFKVDPATSGTYTSPDGELTVQVVASEKTFSFTSNHPLEWVIVKGGNAANIYEFAPSASGAAGLVAPQGKGLSHLDFCYSPPRGGGEGGSSTGGTGGSSTGGSSTGGSSTGGSSTGGSSTGGGGSCPPNYQLYVASEGAAVCTPIPNDGSCPVNYVLENTAQGPFCIPVSIR